MVANNKLVIRETGENPQDTPVPKRQLLSQTLRILIPTHVSSLLWISSQIITLYYVGKYLNTPATAQYGAGIFIVNAYAFYIVMGYASAIDTLSSQAFGADPKSPEVGEALQMALVVSIAFGLVFSIVFFFIFDSRMCGSSEEEFCVGFAQFLRYSPLYFFAQIINGVASKSMYAQKIPEVVVAANAVAALGSPLANYFLTPLGIHGAALALGATVALSSMMHILCMLYHPKVVVRYAPWPSPRLVSLKSWNAFLKVGGPAATLMLFDYYMFLLPIAMASKVLTSELAVRVVAMDLVGFMIPVALGMPVAASVIVGNSLGAGRPRQAKQFAYFVLGCSLILALITAALMLAFGTHIAHFYGKEEDVIENMKKIIPLLALSYTGHSVHFCLQGIFRGAGCTVQAALSAFLKFLCVFVLLLFIPGFLEKIGLYGFMGGIVVVRYCDILSLCWWMYKFDWFQLGMEARVAERPPQDATDVVVKDSGTNADSTSSSSSRSASVSLTRTRSRASVCNCVYAHEKYEMKLQERSASILEEACCSLHESFAVPPGNR